MRQVSHPLILGLLATSIVITVAIGWTGWRLIQQQRALDARIVTEQLEASASVMAADVREKLADIGERLDATTAGTPPSWPDSTFVAAAAAGAEEPIVMAPGGLPFLPATAPPPLASPLFAAGERAEFLHGRPEEAAAEYRRLAGHADPDVRAGALFRLGRVQRRLRDAHGAFESAATLATFRDRRLDTTGVPAGLAALDGTRLAHQLLGQTTKAGEVAGAMRAGLDRGDWRLSRGAAEFYRDLVSAKGDWRPESWALAAALADAWPRNVSATLPRGQAIAGAAERPVVVLWRVGGRSVAMTATFVDTLVDPPAALNGAWQLGDADDRRLAGAMEQAPPAAISRVISGGGSAWTLRVWPTAQSTTPSRADVLAASLGVVIVFVWGATYLMARVIRREAAVARLQSDFVAAVSHEFRSPLTTMRQMTEMLEAGRVPGEQKRLEYYRVLVAETSRLQRLIETLLNFGRMESGTERYERQELDVGEVVCAAVRDLRVQAAYAAREIDVQGSPGACRIIGDRDALSLAVRNLVDNALKYSPAHSAVRVGWHRTGDQAIVDVTDGGSGIPMAEREAIFEKFVRGRSAISSRVPGSGVGLAMARRVAVAHGGAILLESEAGRGSTFRLSLPCAQPDVPSRPAAS